MNLLTRSGVADATIDTVESPSDDGTFGAIKNGLHMRFPRYVIPRPEIDVRTRAKLQTLSVWQVVPTRLPRNRINRVDHVLLGNVEVGLQRHGVEGDKGEKDDRARYGWGQVDECSSGPVPGLYNNCVPLATLHDIQKRLLQ